MVAFPELACNFEDQILQIHQKMPKKSEYRRKYRKPSLNAAQQIYKENVDYRTNRKFKDFHHEPFDWPGNESDSCSDESSSSYLLPKVTVKHRDLVNKWVESQKKIKKKDLVSFSDIGLQTPNWKLEENSQKDQCTQADFKDEATMALGNAFEMQTFPSDSFHPVTSSPKVKPTKILTDASESVWKNNQITLSRKKSNKPGKKAAKRKPPFHSYGWANEEQSTGCLKSHNILAGKNQVHSTAAQALKKRRMEQCRRVSSVTKNQILFDSHELSNVSAVFQVSKRPQNDILKSEYQRCFSGPSPPNKSRTGKK